MKASILQEAIHLQVSKSVPLTTLSFPDQQIHQFILSSWFLRFQKGKEVWC